MFCAYRARGACADAKRTGRRGMRCVIMAESRLICPRHAMARRPIDTRSWCVRSPPPNIFAHKIGMQWPNPEKRPSLPLPTNPKRARRRLKKSRALPRDVDFKLYEAPVSVENLGVISSFPVGSEIIALANRTTAGQANTGDLKLQSSIPVSYAFDLSANSSGKHAASIPLADTRSADVPGAMLCAPKRRHHESAA